MVLVIKPGRFVPDNGYGFKVIRWAEKIRDAKILMK